MPTLADLANVDLPNRLERQLDGMSLKPLLLGQDTSSAFANRMVFKQFVAPFDDPDNFMNPVDVQLNGQPRYFNFAVLTPT